MLPHVQRQKNTNRRRKAFEKQLLLKRQPEELEVSKTQQRKEERAERIVTERAERRLQKLDSIWGIGLGPIKTRLKWATDLFGR